MRLLHTFAVPRERADAATILRDMTLLADCMPGATLDEVTAVGAVGRVKVKVGPIAATYRGELREVGDRESQETIRLIADAHEVKGLGDSRAEITMELQPQGPATVVKVSTDVALSGRLAQFGGGVVAEVADQILGQFVANLEQHLGPTSAGSEPAPQGPARAAGPSRDAVDPIALLLPSLRDKGPLIALSALAVVALIRLLRPRPRCCCRHVVLHSPSCPDQR